MLAVVNGVAEIAKQHPTDAAKMGLEIAKARGIKPEYGVSFAIGFMQLPTLQNELKTVKVYFLFSRILSQGGNKYNMKSYLGSSVCT